MDEKKLQKKVPEEVKGGNIQPGNPRKMADPVGVVKKPLESDKHADKRLNKLFKKTNAAALGVWGKDKKDKPLAKPDKVKFNPALDKTKEINTKMAQKPLGKPDKDFDPTRQEMIGQGYEPSETEQRKQASKLFGVDLTKPAKKKYNVTLDGDHLGEIEADSPEEADKLANQKWPGHPDDDLLSVEEAKESQEQQWPDDDFWEQDDAKKAEIMKSRGYSQKQINATLSDAVSLYNPFLQTRDEKGEESPWPKPPQQPEYDEDKLSPEMIKVIDNPFSYNLSDEYYDSELNTDNIRKVVQNTNSLDDLLYAKEFMEDHGFHRIEADNTEYGEGGWSKGTNVPYVTDVQNLYDEIVDKIDKIRKQSQQAPQQPQYSEKEKRYVLDGMKSWFGLDPEDFHNQNDYMPEVNFDGELMMEAYKQADEENGFDNMWSEDEVWEAVEGKYNELFDQKYPNGMPQDEDEGEEEESAPAQEPKVDMSETKRMLKMMGYNDDEIQMILNSVIDPKKVK